MKNLQENFYENIKLKDTVNKKILPGSPFLVYVSLNYFDHKR